MPHFPNPSKLYIHCLGLVDPEDSPPLADFLPVSVATGGDGGAFVGLCFLCLVLLKSIVNLSVPLAANFSRVFALKLVVVGFSVTVGRNPFRYDIRRRERDQNAFYHGIHVVVALAYHTFLFVPPLHISEGRAELVGD